MPDPGDSSPSGGAEARGTQHGRGRAGAILGELADALGAALLGLAEEERGNLADRAAAIGEAARCAARSLDRSDSPDLARGIDRVADRIDAVAGLLRARKWREIALDTADFARRRPGLFGPAAASIGFLAARLLTPQPAAADGTRQAADGDGAAGAVGYRRDRDIR